MNAAAFIYGAHSNLEPHSGKLAPVLLTFVGAEAEPSGKDEHPPSARNPSAPGAPTFLGRFRLPTTRPRGIPPPVTTAPEPQPPLVGIIMGSQSDWETMSHASRMLQELGVPHETRVVSAHRTPDLLFEYASTAESRGLQAIIAGAGGAAHLPGMAASKTLVPVLGVPVESKMLRGIDSLLSIVQMPAGVPVATFAIGRPGAINAALYATAILAVRHSVFREALRSHRKTQTDAVLASSDPSLHNKVDLA